MNALEFLKQYRVCMVRIRKLEEEIQELDDLMSHITPEMSSDRVQSSHPPDKLGQLVAKKVDLETRLMGEIDTALGVMNDIEEVINKVEPVGYQMILQKKYIEGKTWEQVAREVCYDPSWVWVLHRRALAEVDKILASGSQVIAEYRT